METEGRRALALAALALMVSLVGTGLVAGQAMRNRDRIKDANRGLACLLQRALVVAQAEPQTERRKWAIRFYTRELDLLGGPRDDCQVVKPS